MPDSRKIAAIDCSTAKTLDELEDAYKRSQIGLSGFSARACEAGINHAKMIAAAHMPEVIEALEEVFELAERAPGCALNDCASCKRNAKVMVAGRDALATLKAALP
jgi:hypothetical protein